MEPSNEYKLIELSERVMALERFARWTLSAAGNTSDASLALSRIADEARAVLKEQK